MPLNRTFGPENDGYVRFAPRNLTEYAISGLYFTLPAFSALEVKTMTYRSTRVAERDVVAFLDDARGKNLRNKKKAGNKKKTSSKKFDRKCAKKTRFRSREHALESIMSFRYLAISARQDGVSIRIPIRAYQCANPSCHGGWHLTSKPENRNSQSKQNRSA